MSDKGQFTVSKNASLNDDTFKFINGSSGQVFAVVCLQLNGQPTPIFVTPEPIPPNGGGKEFSTKAVVSIWLERDAEACTISTGSISAMAEFDLEAYWLGVVYDNGKFAVQD